MCSAWESYFALRARLKVALLNPLNGFDQGKAGYTSKPLFILRLTTRKYYAVRQSGFFFFSHILHLKVVQ